MHGLILGCLVAKGSQDIFSAGKKTGSRFIEKNILE